MWMYPSDAFVWKTAAEWEVFGSKAAYSCHPGTRPSPGLPMPPAPSCGSFCRPSAPAVTARFRTGGVFVFEQLKQIVSLFRPGFVDFGLAQTLPF